MNTIRNSKTARIVIIGAGPSGIAAATKLIKSGFENVLVIEAESRVGGRIYTVDFADNVVDLGAQWCHGEKKNVVYELVKDLNLLETTGTIYDDYVCIRSNREVLSDDVADVLKTIAFETIPERQKGLLKYEGSLGSYLVETYWRELEKSPNIDRTIAHEFLDNMKKFENSVEASDTVFEVSGQGHLDYWICEGELLLNWKDKGFHTLLKLLMKSKGNETNDLGILNKRVILNKKIEHIAWQKGDEAIIKCVDGQLIEADHIICTVSLGVLKENYKKMFTPLLPPAKCRAIEGLKLGTVNKFFMEFKVPFGPPDWTGFMFLWTQEDLDELRNTDYFWLESVFGFFRVSYQPRILGGWIIGPHGRHMETLTVSEVQKAILWLFRKFFTFPIPEPINFMRTQWYSNPNFRGSYTFRSMYTDELRTGAWDLASPLTNGAGKPVLQFAGEATHTHYYSTVHGAVESGWREAERLIAFYQSRPSQL
ncbi:spermine oxidase-like [Teleopsis dalmanni]|uniref:spermine oxidase-like n=1 Tax=Teleopsis dalmanni TaxID=139649 RepID=UPI0018CEEEA0|nr:spermine oxidase-like [Teleopsis dalmanni]